MDRPTRRCSRGLLAAFAALVLAVIGGVLMPSSPASAAVTGIFADDLTPTIAADPDDASVELGLRFRPQKSGRVTALQYYQSARASDVTRATLWSGSGTELARVSFSATTTIGWRTVQLPTPVTITAGSTYVASYHAPRGGYPTIERDLTTSRTENGFDLPAGAGVYNYGSSSAFPTSTYLGTNYLVDVVFEPLASTSQSPAQTATATPTGNATATPTQTPTATPTTTPTSGPGGGTVVLGRSFPNASTTGVPAGTPLSTYTGPCTIQTNNVVIDAKIVNCQLRILAQGITITRSIINGSIYSDPQYFNGSFTVTDSEIRMPQSAGTGIGDANFTATRVEVTGGSRSINCYLNCTVQDSYVHGQYTDTRGIDHESGIRFNTNSRLIHNTIGCTAPDVPPDAGCSAAITGYPDFDPVQGNTIDNNLILAGSGGYCAYGGSTTGKPFSGQTRNIKYTNNVWQRGIEMGAGGRGYVCGYWGPITSFDSNAPGNVWSSNLYDDGTPVPPAN